MSQNVAKKNSVHNVKKVNNFGAILIGNLPYGFFENELEKYFSQFGEILKVRVARSNKSAAALGHAYILFENAGVAKIAAETMNGYLLFFKSLRCSFIPSHKIKPAMFRHSDRNEYFCPGTMRRRRQQYVLNELRSKQFKKKQDTKLKKEMNVLKKLGIDLEKENKEEPIIMEMDGIDDEISIKTPPNVVKRILRSKKGSGNVKLKVCDANATTVKKTTSNTKVSSLEKVSTKLFAKKSKKVLKKK